jgi:protein-S-isoprenylcysteine O-methyltransferase Ste14
MMPRVHPLMRIPVPWVFLLAYFVGVVLEGYLPSPELEPGVRRAAHAAGFVLLAVGAALAVTCLVMFRKARTTTIPGQESSRLVTHGPYRFSRNPMYVSLTVVYLGEAAALGQLWPLVPLLLTLAYLHWTVIPYEEARLQQSFGATYDAYRARVRRWV